MKLFVTAIGFLISFLPHICVAASEKWQPKADTASAFLLTVNDQTVWQKASATRLPPASLTKLLTALILIENPKLDAWVSMSKHAVNQDGTKIKAKSGDEFQAAYLLGAMLMKSANDACMALVEWDAGSEATFVKKMQLKVKALQLKNTHFTNPCGFDDAQHFSSTEDLLKIAQLANAAPKIKVWTGLSQYPLQSKSKNTYMLNNSNALLGRVEGVEGLKTGFTKKAGKCLIAHGNYNRKEVYLVMLNAPNRWWDADEMIRRAYHDEIEK